MRLSNALRLEGIRYAATVSAECILKSIKKEKCVSVAYDHQRLNFGDSLNKYLFAYLLNSYNLTTYQNSDLIACGSLINYMDRVPVDRVSLYNKSKPVKVWGAGFIQRTLSTQFCSRRPLDLHATRGQKSLRILKNCRNVNIIKEVLGDPGLLLPVLLGIENKPSTPLIGIVLHYSHSDLKHNSCMPKNSIFIDPQRDPVVVANEISMCTHIISTSLHGLILADAMGKQTTFAQARPALIGNTFKFEDYYSGYGFDQLPFPKIILEMIDESIIAKCIKKAIRVERKLVKDNMIGLLESFPFPVEDAMLNHLRSKINQYP